MTSVWHWVTIALAVITLLGSAATPSSPPALRPHLWSPPRVDPLLCETLRNCEDDNGTIRYIKELCRNPSALPPVAVNMSSSVRSRMKRTPVKLPQTKMKPEEQKKILEIHNQFRTRPKPPAGDMLLMKWDNYLAEVAQMWAENCVFEHGFPEELDIVDMGQNLYIGYDPTGHRATLLWWEEDQYYNLETFECEEDQQCGHYTQMAWADSEYLGCGVAKCPTLGYYVVCHYRPQGNVPDISPYTVGAPCSQCWSLKDGGLCSEGLCVSRKDCDSLNLQCACNLTCHNCAILSPLYCRCICKKGWDSTDCSRDCGNLIDWCGESPGWPDRTYCTEMDNLVRDRYCRQMCLQCKNLDPKLSVQEKNRSKDYCCAGQTCDKGWVLDTETCSCYPLCPGPACPSSATPGPEEFSLEEDTLNITYLEPEEREATQLPAEEPWETDAPAVPVRSSSADSLWKNPSWGYLSPLIVCQALSLLWQ